MFDIALALTCLVPLFAPACKAQPQSSTPPSASGQEPPTPPKITPPKLPGTSAGPTAASPLLGSDGQPLAPGRIPENTDPAARAAWEKALAATVLPGAERVPIQAFQLEVDAKVKPTDGGMNQLHGRYEYLAPSCLRTRVEGAGREYLRGPAGDFMIDPARNETIAIGAERESEQDRKQIDQLHAIAKNFVALTDPKALRIAKLAKLASPPAGVPPAKKKRAAELVWIEAASPDFRLTRNALPGAGGERLYRVELGLAPDTSLPEFAVLHDGVSTVELDPTTVFLELARWEPAGTYRVPRQLFAWEIDARTAGGALKFGLDPTTDVFVTNAVINPPLTPDAFRPPAKK